MKIKKTPKKNYSGTERNADGVSVCDRLNALRLTYFQLTRRWLMLILLLVFLLRSYLSGTFRTLRDLWYEILIYLFCTMDEYNNCRYELDHILIALDMNLMED